MKYHWFAFCKDSLLLVSEADGTYGVPYQELPPTVTHEWTTIMNVALPSGVTVKAYQMDAPVTEPPYEMCPLRKSFYKLDRAVYIAAGKCAELLFWNNNTQYCGVCGGKMHFHTDISKRCEQCGKEVWPQLAPAVIVRINRGKDEILMARAHNFRGDFYGLIAGFVETGETLEQAVEREVMEETGLSITNIRYFASQPWPFPAGIMVGFTADYASGTLHIQHEELRTAAWFHRDHLPQLPEPLSIARKLVDAWLFEN